VWNELCESSFGINLGGVGNHWIAYKGVYTPALQYPKFLLFGKQIARLVGAPLVGALGEGTHKGCPYETR
jgi:hypothetical protein